MVIGGRFVQYIGGIWSVRMGIPVQCFEGCLQYTRRCFISGGASTLQWSVMDNIQYCGEISSVLWKDIFSTVERYHQYYGRISSLPWRDIISVYGRIS